MNEGIADCQLPIADWRVSRVQESNVRRPVIEPLIKIFSPPTPPIGNRQLEIGNNLTGGLKCFKTYDLAYECC